MIANIVPAKIFFEKKSLHTIKKIAVKPADIINFPEITINFMQHNTITQIISDTI